MRRLTDNLGSAQQHALRESQGRWNRSDEREAVREWVLSWPLRFFLTLNPAVPGLRSFEVVSLGSTLAKRLKDRASLPPRSIVLIPEQSAQGLWHYHGFVATATSEQSDFMLAKAERVLEDAMRRQIVRKFRANRYLGHEFQPSCLIESLRDKGDGAFHYATKYWDAQKKQETAIFL